MKTLIIAMNSKFIHSALAPWYLKAACGDACGEVAVAEYNINEHADDILTSIYLQKPDIAAFSCYIWNISLVLRVASGLKKVLPGTVIVLGGPEVSYDAEKILKEHRYIDYILAGEGEQSFPRLIKWLSDRMAFNTSNASCHGRDGALDVSRGYDNACASRREYDDAHTSRNECDTPYVSYCEDKYEDLKYGESMNDGCPNIPQISGLVRRFRHDILSSAPAIIEDLGEIPSPYTDEMLQTLKNKIAYFESSRGCPFSCSYCLSSASEGVRFFPLKRVFAELDRLVASGVKQIKFVDRTFNVNKKRAKAIIEHILNMSKDGIDCNFHLEVGADLFDEEMLQLLETAPKGLFQIEAGIQTINEKTLDAICRKTDLEKLFRNLHRLKRNNNVHIHTDLIAGLPHEDYNSFIRSFNSVYSIKAHHLQLGFLKFLKGTALLRDASEMGFTFQDHPPYEVLSGKDIGYDELIILKGIAELVDRFHNSGRFMFSLDYAIENCFSSPFEFYKEFYLYLKNTDAIKLNTGLREQYAVLNSFVTGRMKNYDVTVFQELLRIDFLASDRSGTLPDFMEKRNDSDFNKQCYDYLRSSDRITEMIPEAAGLSTRMLLRKVHFERFVIDLNLGDVSQLSGKAIMPEGNSFKQGSKATVLEGEAPSEGDAYQLSNKAAKGGMVLLFSYFSKDRVTGRYPFFKV